MGGGEKLCLDDPRNSFCLVETSAQYRDATCTLLHAELRTISLLRGEIHVFAIHSASYTNVILMRFVLARITLPN